MKILLFIAIGFIVGYVVKDLLTKESEVVYHIKRLRAKKGGEISVESQVILEKQGKNKVKNKEKQPKERRKFFRKNK